MPPEPHLAVPRPNEFDPLNSALPAAELERIAADPKVRNQKKIGDENELHTGRGEDTGREKNKHGVI